MPDPSRHESSIDLMHSMSRGDVAALETLLSRHLDGLRVFIRLRTGARIRARESGSDLVQSVCREVLEDWQGVEFRSEAAFKHWLYQTALRKILDKNKFHSRGKRDMKRQESLDDEKGMDVPLAETLKATGLTPSRDAALHEDVRNLESAFDRLDEKQREIITLIRVVGLSHDEAAAELGITAAYCRTLLSRALARLAMEMRPGT